MTLAQQYAYIDESGTVAPFSGSQYLVIAQLRIAHPRPIGLKLKRMRQWHGRTLLSGEMKASATEPTIIQRFLAALAEEEIRINAVIVDKRCIIRPPTDSETIYRTAIAHAVLHAVSVYPRLDICLDRRYTTQRQRDMLEWTIREHTASVPDTVVLIRQEDSIQHKELQVVDFIAWAFFQKYERGDDRFFQLIAHRVDGEEIIAQSIW